MKTMKLFSLLFMTAMMIWGCSKTDMYQDNNQNPEPEPTPVKPEANLFDFSTTQSINLAIDYSVYKAGAVWFSIYAEYPLSDDTDPVLRNDLQPVFEAFTNTSGIFNETVTLPAYAEHLYVYTGNFFVKDQLLECDVLNGSAKVTAQSSPAATRGFIARTRGEDGIQTNSLGTLYQLSYIVDWKTGDKTDTRIYKDWHTPLGTWDANSGRPSYLMTSSDESYSKMAFTEAEMKSIKQTISNTLIARKQCPMKYRQAYDLALTEASEVAVTLVGGNTCWNSTMGYYYYAEGQTPTKPENLNIIMLFPNTQDGQSSFIKDRGNNYNGNIALSPGDMVQLMYYPNIASGDYSNATKIFPKGTRIGFILKSNGWGMQKTVGDKKYYNSYLGERKDAPTVSRQYNAWAASTDGLSYSTDDSQQNKADNGTYAKPNPEGQARTAKFAYENAQGKQYAIVSFEDACNDDDFDDVILALKPVGVFEKLPTPEEKETKTTGVYAFEDLWPAKGDYDMNDAVVDFEQVLTWKTPDVKTTEPKIYKEAVKLTTYQNYVTLKSGLAVTIENKENPTSVKMKTIKGADVKEVNFEKDDKTYLLTDNITGTLGTQFIIEFEYSSGITESQKSTVKPFIYRNEGDGRWEVHIPREAPTSKMITSYFGTEDDLSDPSKGIYYVREGYYPFAFFLSGTTIEPFKNTILLRDNETKPIDELYPKFRDWSTSKGSKNSDWYK